MAFEVRVSQMEAGGVLISLRQGEQSGFPEGPRVESNRRRRAGLPKAVGNAGGRVPGGIRHREVASGGALIGDTLSRRRWRGLSSVASSSDAAWTSTGVRGDKIDIDRRSCFGEFHHHDRSGALRLQIFDRGDQTCRAKSVAAAGIGHLLIAAGANEFIEEDGRFHVEAAGIRASGIVIGISFTPKA